MIRMRDSRSASAARAAGGSDAALPEGAQVAAVHRAAAACSLPASIRDHRRPSLAARPLGRRGLPPTRSDKNAFVTHQRRRRTCSIAQPGDGRARSSDLHVVRCCRRPVSDRLSIFVHSKLLLRLMDFLGLRREPQTHPGLDPRPSAEPPQVVRRGVPRGRRRSFRAEVRRRESPRVLDRARRPQGRPARRFRSLWARCRRSAATRLRSSRRRGTAAIRSGALTLSNVEPLEPARVGSSASEQQAATRAPPRDLVWAAGHRRSRRSRADRPGLRLLGSGSRELLGRHRRNGAQHLRAADATARRPRDPDLPAPGAPGQAADRVRRRFPDPLASVTSRTRSAA